MKPSLILRNDWKYAARHFGDIDLARFHFDWHPAHYYLTVMLAGFGFTIGLANLGKEYAPDQYAADDVHPFQDAEALRGNIVTPAGAQSGAVICECGSSTYNPVNQRDEE